MSDKVLIEAFGSIVSEDTRNDDVSLEDAMDAALQRVDAIVGLDSVESIVTGMNADVTYALQDAVEASDRDIDVRAFYPNVNNIAEEDDVDYQTAWKQGFTWRNNRLFVNDEDDDEQEVVDLCVRVGDAGNNGNALLQHARRKGVPALGLNLDSMVDRSAAYGDDEDSPAEAAA